MKQVLVTGGAGFLGSHLCERLLSDGASVTCLDNLSTGRRENIAHLQGSGRFRFLNRDVTEPIDLSVDEIYNLACPASPPAYQKSPVGTLLTSVLGARNVLDLAVSRDAKVLQASTSEVYGDPLVHPQTEEYWGNVNPVGIRSCYDEGKRSAETLFFDYHREFGARIKVVRIFNTYGPRMSPGDGRVVSNFIRQALRGEDITVYGDGSQTRSFCFVSDLIEGLVRMMGSDEKVTGPVNLGREEEATVLDLARTVIRLTGSSSRIVFRPLPGDDPVRRRPALRKAAELLDWRPETSLEQGLSRMIEDFKKGSGE